MTCRQANKTSATFHSGTQTVCCVGIVNIQEDNCGVCQELVAPSEKPQKYQILLATHSLRMSLLSNSE